MIIFLHKEGQLYADKVEITPKTRIGDIIKDYLQEYALGKDYLEDLEAYLENEHDELSKDSSSSNGDFKPGSRIHFSRCKSLNIQVLYMDQVIVLDKVFPAFTLRKIRKLAGKELGIPQNDLKKLRFKRSLKEDFLDFDVHTGSLTTYPSCEVKLYLLEPVKIQGFKPASFDLIEKHIKSLEFQDGEARGKWSIITEPEDSFPELFIRIISPQGEFFLKINVEGYPAVAPLGRLWDMENNQILPSNKRPTGINNVIAFRMEYGSPIRNSLYIPCDRGAMSCHPEWKQKYPDLWWKPDDTLTKYVSFVYRLLNDY